MKIVEAQSAVLSNYEVLAHVNATRAKPWSNSQKHQNVETVIKEVTDYLSPTDSSTFTIPTATRPSPLPPYISPYYTPTTIRQLLEKLKPHTLSRTNAGGLYKNEVLMIVNLRPQDIGLLDCVIEECDERFSQEEQLQILEIIRDVLGGPEDEDVNGNGEVNGYSVHNETEEMQGVENVEVVTDPACITDMGKPKEV